MNKQNQSSRSQMIFVGFLFALVVILLIIIVYLLNIKTSSNSEISDTCPSTNTSETKEDETTKSQEISDAKMRINDLANLITGNSMTRTVSCEEEDLPGTATCDVAYGKQFTILSQYSEIRDGVTYYIYLKTNTLALSGQTYAYLSDEKYYEYNGTTREITDVTQREEEKLKKQHDEEDKENQRKLTLVIDYLGINESGTYFFDWENVQDSPRYTFASGEVLQIFLEKENYTVILYQPDSNKEEYRYFKIDNNNNSIKEITSEEATAPLSE